MQELISGQASIGQIVFIALGCWAAWMTGRACAQTWRSYVSLVAYLLMLGFGVRFIHFALFGATLTSVSGYLSDTLLLVLVGTLGYRFARTNQMVRQYHWLYERASPFSWKPRG